jgi:K+/H+ antiporter YhaU regulatory subunit KhtT
MQKKMKVQMPRYQQIAADIAAKIADHEYKVGDRIYARSSLAGKYGVSSETVRRAICILADLGIVESEKGSGVHIRSYEKAVEYVKQFEDIKTISQIKEDLEQSVNRQLEEMEYFQSCLSDLMFQTERFRSLNPFSPFQITITDKTPYLNQTTSEINFWHHTAATVVAIKRKDVMMISPGPYAQFQKDDILYFMGDEESLERVYSFLYPELPNQPL